MDVFYTRIISKRITGAINWVCYNHDLHTTMTSALPFILIRNFRVHLNSYMEKSKKENTKIFSTKTILAYVDILLKQKE